MRYLCSRFLDDALTDALNAQDAHPSSLLVLISDHCSSGTMLDRERTAAGRHWLNIASSMPNEDSLASGDGNAMLCALLDFFGDLVDMDDRRVDELAREFPPFMAKSWVGGLQHPCVTWSDDDVAGMRLFRTVR